MLLLYLKRLLSNWNSDFLYLIPCSAKVACVIWQDVIHEYHFEGMGLLSDTQICGLRMRRECRERFPRHRLPRKLLVCDPGMHHGACVTHVPWCMSELLTRGGSENVPGIPGACTIRNFTYLARGPWKRSLTRMIVKWHILKAQIASVSDSMVLIYFYRNIPVSAAEGWLF